MLNILKNEIWFITGSQHLYGEETLRQVAQNASHVVNGLNAAPEIILTIKDKGVVTTSDKITQVLIEANSSPLCAGVIVWMHTFSPAKMWINGLQQLHKPLCHLHTQFNAEIPWETIDMDFMNLNQSAHGDREFGFMMTRMRKNRKVIVGHWQSSIVQKNLGAWIRVAMGWQALQHTKVARIGDNMRNVAVTEGDKVDAQLKFGVQVNGYDSSDVTRYFESIQDHQIDQLIEEYEEQYTLSQDLRKGGIARQSLREAAKIEIALRTFLMEGGFSAYTDTFENLGSFSQLPGIASQRLMMDGYGFGAEGDWKTAGLLRAMKVMSIGQKEGTSFMEDYTYHFGKDKSYVLGSHMLEICPSIADGKPSCEIHPLGIGGKSDPVRLVFDAVNGPAINASLIDMGNRFRLIVNEVNTVKPPHNLPKLPVARAYWEAMPNLEIAAEAWIHAGGAHHTVYTQALNSSNMEDFAEMAGIELLVIDKNTEIRDFKNLIHSNESYFSNFQKGY